MPHMTEIREGKPVNAWKALQCRYVTPDGEVVNFASDLNIHASYMLEGCEKGKPSNTTHITAANEMEGKLNAIPEAIRDEVIIIGSHPTYNADGSLNENDLVDVLQASASNMLEYIALIRKFQSSPLATRLNDDPTLPAEFIGEKKAREGKRGQKATTTWKF